jgi:hypothetical protein
VTAQGCTPNLQPDDFVTDDFVMDGSGTLKRPKLLETKILCNERLDGFTTIQRRRF